MSCTALQNKVAIHDRPAWTNNSAKDKTQGNLAAPKQSSPEVSVPVCLQFVICDTFGCVLQIDACVCYTGDLDHTTHNTRSYSTCMVTILHTIRGATPHACDKIVRLPHEPPQIQDREATSRAAGAGVFTFDHM